VRAGGDGVSATAEAERENPVKWPGLVATMENRGTILMLPWRKTPIDVKAVQGGNAILALLSAPSIRMHESRRSHIDAFRWFAFSAARVLRHAAFRNEAYRADCATTPSDGAVNVVAMVIGPAARRGMNQRLPQSSTPFWNRSFRFAGDGKRDS